MSEIKVNIEEFIEKVSAFDEDKYRAEKISKKAEYLDSLCPNFSDKITFKAVFDAMFPDDALTSKYLKKEIDEIFKKGMLQRELLGDFFYIQTPEELEEVYKKIKEIARKIIIKRHMEELRQIERMYSSKAKSKSIKIKVPNENDIFSVNSGVVHSGLAAGGMTTDKINNSFGIPPKQIEKEPKISSRHRRPGSSPSKEILDLLVRDRLHRIERDKTLAQKIKESKQMDKLNAEIKQRDAQRALKKDNVPEMGMHR